MNDWLDAEKRIERAQQLCEARRWYEALGEIEQALDINPSQRSWWSTKAYVLDQLERYEEAIEAYETVLELGGEDREMSTTLALDYVKVGELVRAAEIFEELALREPDFEPAYCHRIMLYAQLGDHDRAEEMFYLAQQIEEECPHCFWHLGCSLAVRDETRRAVYCWQRVLEIDPCYRGARRRIAEAHARLDDIELAREYYLAEYRESPGDVGLLMELGELLMHNGRAPEAMEKFRQVLELDLDNTEAYCLLGDAMSMQGDDEGACTAYEAATSIDCQSPEIFAKLGQKLMRLGRFAHAKEVFDAVLTIAPEDRAALMSAGNCALEVGDPDEAQRCFEQLIELDGCLPGAYHNLGVCHFLRQEFEQGIRQCEVAVSLKDDYILARQKLVLANMHLDRWSQARRLLDESLERDPHNAALLRIRQRWPYRRVMSIARRLAGTVRKMVATSEACQGSPM